MQNFIKTFLFTVCLLLNFSFYAQSPVLVEDLNAGTGDAFDEFNFKGAYLGEAIVFPADNGNTGIEPFILENGAISLLLDINSGTDASDPREFTEFSGKVYFTAFDPVNGGAVWATDGATTELMIDVSSDMSAIRPLGLTVAGSGSLYFSYDGNLYKSDGTNTGTVQVPGGETVNFTPNWQWAGPVHTTYEDGIAFLSDEGQTMKLWAATDSIIQLGEITSTSFFYDFFGLNEVANGLAFAVQSSFDSDITGLYSFDKNTGNLGKYEINGSTDILPGRVMKLNDETIIAMIYDIGFVAIDGIAGNEVIVSEETFSLVQGQELPHTIVGEYLLFPENEGFLSMTVMTSDGTIPGSSSIDVDEIFPSNFITFGDYAFWAAGTSNNFEAEIWYTKPSTNTSELYYKYMDGSPIKSVLLLGVQNDRLYYLSNIDQDAGRELYYIELGGLTSAVEIEKPENYSLKFYGNQGTVLSNYDEAIDINIFDLAGRQIKSQSGFTNTSFELNLPANIYLLECSGRNGKIVEKVFIK